MRACHRATHDGIDDAAQLVLRRLHTGFVYPRFMYPRFMYPRFMYPGFMYWNMKVTSPLGHLVEHTERLIEVVDLLKNPQLAAGDQILAIPTLVRRLPAPLKRIIGDLSNTEKVLVGLDIRPRDPAASVKP